MSLPNIVIRVLPEQQHADVIQRRQLQRIEDIGFRREDFMLTTLISHEVRELGEIWQSQLVRHRVVPIFRQLESSHQRQSSLECVVEAEAISCGIGLIERE